MQKMILFALVVCAGVSRAADVSGSWQLNLVLNGQEVASARVEFIVAGTKLTGRLNELKLDRSVEGEVLRFTATRPNGAVFGKLEGRAKATRFPNRSHRERKQRHALGGVSHRTRSTLRTRSPLAA
jgi:hypothetical protein